MKYPFWYNFKVINLESVTDKMKKINYSPDS